VSQLRLALVIHNHQPIGNFDGVFEQAYQDSYKPFLDLLGEFPSLAITLHNSGSLLEWLVEHRPEYLDQIRELADRGQIEIIGGPFYEPILASIPQRDRIGQIQQYSKYLENLFGQPVRGMWVPELVWEQSFARDIVDAGIEYTVLDDSHFRSAGHTPDELTSQFLTEDEGRLLQIFPVSEPLRYAIPFDDVHKSIEILREQFERNPNSVAVFGDDGEKFGTWPGTKEAVFEEGWLRNFFQLLQDNGEWLKVVTLAECVENLMPAGRTYLPDSSYREMTEWVLPAERQRVLLSLRKDKEKNDLDWPELSNFVRGGFWRNFRNKYPETNEMYARMLGISERLEKLTNADSDREYADRLSEARTALYRGQCNCSYWHGAFGGLYLPHLRHAVYAQLIAADTILEKVDRAMKASANGVTGASPDRWVEVESKDFNLDARPEVRVAGDRLAAYFTPAVGGHLYELDIRSIRHNLLATLNRRPEIYHEAIRQAANPDSNGDDLNAASIQGEIKCKQENLDQKIVYDEWPRKALVDHFLQPGLSLEDFQAGKGHVSDFHTGVYQSLLKRSRERVEACFARRAPLASYSVQVTKSVALETANGASLQIRYDLEDLPVGMPIHFAVEFNLAGLPGGVDDRYYYDHTGKRQGRLDETLDQLHCERIGLVDEWLGVDVSLDFPMPCSCWAFPIETVSQSEGGFETVHQACCVVPHWEFVVPEDGRWSVELTLGIDTSAALARELCKTAEPRPV
jgi:4-alpha-glucanotransferase